MDNENERKQSELRTYRRREVTRSSGFHVIDGTTGGECIVKRSERLHLKRGKNLLIFNRHNLKVPLLFNNTKGIVAFAGYIYSNHIIETSLILNLCGITPGNYCKNTFKHSWRHNGWQAMGIHICISSKEQFVVKDAEIRLTFTLDEDSFIDCIGFDFDAITYGGYMSDNLEESFYQRTPLSVPAIYYLPTDKLLNTYLTTKADCEKGQPVVMKSCNRCGRYIPININDELHTLGFVLHCKKRAPCTHSTFMNYSVQNIEELEPEVIEEMNIENGKITSYYGHQLECKACKKFYVNAPLNPMRDTQQHREDSLRRRAIENLVDKLLKCNTVHFEYEHRTGEKFTNHIWEKFNHKCFKCGKTITIDEMDLDHTMPLAYLYRMDEGATCLCKECNSKKSDFFPSQFYSPDELIKLSDITEIPLTTLKTTCVNEEVLQLLIENVVWYFDVFLTSDDYAKIRGGILTADKINDSIKRVIAGKVDLAEEYKKIKGCYPTSVTIQN